MHGSLRGCLQGFRLCQTLPGFLALSFELQLEASVTLELSQSVRQPNQQHTDDVSRTTWKICASSSWSCTLSDHGFRSGPNPNPNLWVLPRVHTWESFTPLAAQTETSPQVTVKISYFSHDCDKIPDRGYFRKEGSLWLMVSEWGILHQGRKGMAEP